MPDFLRQSVVFSFFSRIPLIASGVWICFCLGIPPVILPTASGAVRTADIPIVAIPQNTGELHGLARGLNATSVLDKSRPYQSALAATEESQYAHQYDGSIQLASGNSGNVSTKIRTETVKPAVSFREAPSQVAGQPLGYSPYQNQQNQREAVQQESQPTRPIRPAGLQRPKPLPNKTNRIATVSGINPADSSGFDSEMPTEQTLEELQFAPMAENDFMGEEGANERRFVNDSMDSEEPNGYLRRDPYLETMPALSQNSPNDTSSEAQDSSADFAAAGADDSDLLRRALPPRKEKSEGEGKLALMSLDTQLLPVLSVLGSLCLVLGAFFLFVLFMKKVGPKNGGNLPKEALENVGRYPLNQKLQLNLIRLGNRLILVAVTPDGGVETISEIESQDEVAQILAQCRKLDPNSSQAQFKSVLDEFAQEKSPGGFFGPNDPKRKSSASPSLSSLLAGGLRENNQQRGGIYG